MTEVSHNKTLNGISCGLSGVALIGAYSICACAVLGRNAVFALVCVVACALCSLKAKGSVFAPSAILLVPLFSFSFGASVFFPALSICLGGLICLILKAVFKNKKIPSCVILGGSLGLTLAATVLLTNTYFGIGATGTTAAEMLSNYRYLGFHPDFRGLLYGTITLFAMITYPFKFRKLNKYLPAEFITIAIPFIINLLLNPDASTTTTNEFTSSAAFITLATEYSSVPSILTLSGTAFSYGFIFFAITVEDGKSTPVANITAGFLSGIPAEKYKLRGYSVASAITVIIISVSVFLLFPRLIFRFPLPCAGAMLIVSAWQRVPYKLFPVVLKRKNIIDFIFTVICAVSFVILSVPTAVFICIIVAIVSGIFNRRTKKEVEV